MEEFKRHLRRGWIDFEQFTVDVIYGRKERTQGIKAYAFFLACVSVVFNLLAQLRLFLYKHRILHNHHLGCLVVVVGNLTVGGTGKTPIVEKFARTLTGQGRKVAILSRGYKSKKETLWKKWWRFITHSEETPPKVVSDGKEVLLDSELAGDEPYMLAKNLPGVPVLVDKNRVKAGFYAIKKFGVDTLILDDGFQYLALKEQLNLLLIDKSNPFGNRHLLPRGILREPIKHIRRASYVFITKSDGKPDPELSNLIHEYKPEAEIIECTHMPQYLQEVNGEGRLELTALKGKRVGALSGIAMPESFEGILRRFGAEICHNQRFLDHHRFTQRELDRYFRRARKENLDMVVTTEKDAVRLKKDFQPDMPLYYIRLEIEILSGVKDFEEAVSRICFSEDKVLTPKPADDS